MARFIFFALIAALVWAWWSRRASRSGQAKAPPVAEQVRPSVATDVMQPCAHCGAHVPQQDGISVTQGDVTHWYCSSAHRALGPRPPA